MKLRRRKGNCSEIPNSSSRRFSAGQPRGGALYVLSGSLLGVDLKDVRSVPVGYMDVLEMYPLDFEEFAYANKVSPKIIAALRKSFQEKRPSMP